MAAVQQTRDAQRDKTPPPAPAPAPVRPPAQAPQAAGAQGGQFAGATAAGALGAARSGSLGARAAAGAQGAQFAGGEGAQEQAAGGGLGGRKPVPSGYRALLDVQGGDGGTWRVAMPLDASFGATVQPGSQRASVHFSPGILLMGPQSMPDLAIERIEVDLAQMTVADLKASMPGAESGAAAIGQFEIGLASQVVRTYLMSPLSVNDALGTLDPGHEGGLIGSILDQTAPGWGQAKKQGGKKGQPRRFDLGSVSIQIDDSSVISAGIDTKTDSVYIHLDRVTVFALDDHVEMSGLRLQYRLPDHRLSVHLGNGKVNTGLGSLNVLKDKSLSYSLDDPGNREKSLWSYLVYGPMATSKYAADKAAEAIDNKIRQAARDLVASYFPPALEARSAAELYAKTLGLNQQRTGKGPGASDHDTALMELDLTQGGDDEEKAPESGAPLAKLDKQGDTADRERQVLYRFPLQGSADVLGTALGGGELEIAVDAGTDLTFSRSATSLRLEATGGKSGGKPGLFLHHAAQPWMDDFRIQRLEYDHQTGKLDIDSQPQFGEYTEKLLGAMIHHYILPQTMTPELEAVHHAVGTKKSDAISGGQDEAGGRFEGREILARVDVAGVGEVFAVIDKGQTLSVAYEDNSAKDTGGGGSGHDTVRISAGTGLQIVATEADFVPTLTLREITYDVRTSAIVISGDEAADIGASVEGLLESVVEGLLPTLPGGTALTSEHEDRESIEQRRSRAGAPQPLPSDGKVLYEQEMGALGTIAVMTAPGYDLKLVQDNDGAHLDSGAGSLRIFVTGAGLQAALHDVRMTAEAQIDFDLRSGAYDAAAFDWAQPLTNGAAEADKQTWGEQLMGRVADHFAGEAIRQYMPKPAEAGATERVLASVEANGMSIDIVIDKTQAISAGLEGDGSGQRLVIDAGSGFTWRVTGNSPIGQVPASRIQRIELDLTSGELTIDAQPDIGELTETVATKFLHHTIRQPGLIPAEARETLESLGFGGLLAAANQVEEIAPSRAVVLWQGAVPQAGAVDASIDGLGGLELSVSGPLTTVQMPGKGLLVRMPELGFAFELQRVVYDLNEARLVAVESTPQLGAYEQQLITAASRHFMPAVVRAQLDPSALAGASGAAEQRYTVKSGDTLGKIARAHNVAGGYQALASANGITDPNRIRVGQELIIPGSSAPAPAPGGAGLTGEKGNRYVHFTYASAYGPVEICTDAGSTVSVTVKKVPRQSRGGAPADAIVLEASGGRGVYIHTKDGAGQLARFDGDGLSRFVYFLDSGDVEMTTLVGGQPGAVGPQVEQILEASMMTFVAPQVPAELREKLGVVTAQEAVDGPELGRVPRGFVPLGVDIPTGAGLGNLRVFVHPQEAIGLSTSGGKSAITTRHGIYFQIDGFPTVPCFKRITWDRLTQTVEADGLGPGTEGLLTQALHTFVDVYLRSAGHDAGVSTLHSQVSQRPSRISGAFPLYEGEHYGMYLEPGYNLSLEITASRIEFKARGLFVDGAKIARYGLEGFYYDFNTQKANLDLESRGILSWLLKPLVKLGIGIKGLVDDGEWGLTGVLHALLPEKVKRKGYNLFQDQDLRGTFDQIAAKFEAPDPDAPTMDVAGLVDDLQDFDVKAGHLQHITERIATLKRSGGSKPLRKSLERVVERLARFDRGKRVRLEVGRAKYVVTAYELDGHRIEFFLQDRDLSIAFDTNDGRFYSGSRAIEAELD